MLLLLYVDGWREEEGEPGMGGRKDRGIGGWMEGGRGKIVRQRMTDRRIKPLAHSAYVA